MPKKTYTIQCSELFMALELLEEQFKQQPKGPEIVEKVLKVLGVPLGLTRLRAEYERVMLKVAKQLDNN